MENFAVLMLVLVLIILVSLGLRAVWFVNNFKKVSLNMQYDEVVKIVGKPKREIDTENIKNCVWRIAVLRGWFIERTVVFKDGKVVSIHNDSHYA